MLLDFSRVALEETQLRQLLGLAAAVGLDDARRGFFAGAELNSTERRRVLHALWRDRDFARLLPAAEAEECRQSLQRMLAFAGRLREGKLPGPASPDRAASRIRHVIHVGIGGSLLGPKLLRDAFGDPAVGPEVHFLSSIDAGERERLLARIDPQETFVLLVSKSFTTSEVLAHGRRLLAWQASRLDPAAARRRLCAITASTGRAEAFGVPREQILQMGEWTGGRFSLWSPVSLAGAVAMGPEAFSRLCAGGAAMDRHFLEAAPAENLPVLHALISCWHRNVCDYRCRALIPYDSRLRGLPAWLQQVEMESNGKRVDLRGEAVRLGTAPVVLGDCGTDAQHSLFQAFHQGTDTVPLDLVGVLQPEHGDAEAQALLVSNLLAQATALAIGRDARQLSAAMQREGKSGAEIDRLLPHRTVPGNRPSVIILLDRLDPESLGRLLVFYEHSVFVQSLIWGINAFDQWGVELGKDLAASIAPVMLSGDAAAIRDLPGVPELVAYIRRRTAG